MRSTRLTQLALAFMILLNSAANSNSVSGVYVQKFADGILFIQIVKSPDGKVSGRVEVVSMQPSGILKDRSYSLEGTVDGNQISLQTNVILGLGTSLSGTIDGETLQLISDTGQVTLVKSDLDTFVEEKSILSAKGAKIARAQQEATDQAEAKDLEERLISDAQSIKINLSRLAILELEADNFIKQTTQSRDAVVNRIEELKANLPFVPANDGGEAAKTFYDSKHDLRSLKNDFFDSQYSYAAEYNELRSLLENFKSLCDSWLPKYSTTKPLQCGDYDAYFQSYQTSRESMKIRFDEAANMFVIE